MLIQVREHEVTLFEELLKPPGFRAPLAETRVAVLLKSAAYGPNRVLTAVPT